MPTPATTLQAHTAAPASRIYLSPPHMSAEGYELDYVREAFATNWIAPIGPHVSALEEEFAAMNGSDHAAALSCGTAAVHLALQMLNVGPGDEVVCSSFTFCASANPAVYLGAKPVFIDSDPATWNMDPALLAETLRRRARADKLPKAVVVVDLYGQSADHDPILAACDEYGVPVIEDAAEALGSTYRGVRTGNFGAFGVFSFNGNKIITGSFGRHAGFAEPRVDRQGARACPRRPAPPPRTTSTWRSATITASATSSPAFCAASSACCPLRIARKRDIFAAYRARLGKLPGIRFMPLADYGQSNCWLTCLTIDPREFGASREDVRLALEADDIESRPLWKPLHLQPVFAGLRDRRRRRLQAVV